MKLPERDFVVRSSNLTQDVPTALIVGVAGESGTGKTVSAIRLALGMVRVLGGRVCAVDTEALRALNYRIPRGPFEFDHIDFAPPFGPLDYIVAIRKAVATGARVIVVDSMTHEHSGEGGVMDQIDRFLDEKCGDDWAKREKMNMVAHARIKPQRRALNNYILQLAREGVILILCYRASDKVKPVKGEGVKHIGFAPETTSPLRFEMTQGFLLMPGSKGAPTANPETFDEKIWSKTPMQFEKWQMTGKQLDESVGEKLALWAAGKQSPAAELPDEVAAFLAAVASARARGVDMDAWLTNNFRTKSGAAVPVKNVSAWRSAAQLTWLTNIAAQIGELGMDSEPALFAKGGVSVGT